MTTVLTAWVEGNGLRRDRRGALGLALLALVICVASLIGGSIVQGALHLGLQMGWGQQLAAALAAVGVAAALKETRALLGLRWPESRAWGWALVVGLSIGLLGVGVDALAPSESAPRTLEYFLYEATAPGLGEELSMRGPWLCLLLVGLSRWRSRAMPAVLLLLSALPFVGLHLLEPMPAFKFALVSLYTGYAAVTLGWLRLQSGSIWPAVLAHNIANVGGSLMGLALLGR